MKIFAMRKTFRPVLLLMGMTLLMMVLARSCAVDDLGLCIIKTSGDDLVYEEITIEECQEIFGNTPGAGGWSWDPQD